MRIKKHSDPSVGILVGITYLREHIDFLQDFDPRCDVEHIHPGESLGPDRHRLLLGRAARTLWNVMQRGGTEEELIRATKFALIAVDAEKHLLDTEQAKVKYGFRDLESKYGFKNWTE